MNASRCSLQDQDPATAVRNGCAPCLIILAAKGRQSLLSGFPCDVRAATSKLDLVLGTFMSSSRPWLVRNGCALSTLFVLERDCVTVTQVRRGICTQTSPYPLQFPCWRLEHLLLVPNKESVRRHVVVSLGSVNRLAVVLQQ